MSLRPTLHLPRRRAARGTSFARALRSAPTPALREELLNLQRMR